MPTAARITSWIREHLATWKSGTRLPSDRELAVQFGVSPMTVRRALGTCAREGFLVRVQGKGTFVAPLDTACPTVSPRLTSWERVVNHLESACREGELKRGDELPSHKQMQHKFRTGPLTVSRACRELERRGWVTRTGKRYTVSGSSRLSRSPSRLQILLLAHSEKEAERLFTCDFMAMTLQKMESELLSCGYSLSFAVYDGTAVDVRPGSLSGQTLHGIILTGEREGRMGHDEFDRFFPKLQTLRRSGARVLVLTTDLHRRIAGVKFFSTSHTTTVMCRELARFIAENHWNDIAVLYDASVSGEQHLMDVFRLFPELDNCSPNAQVTYRIIGPVDRSRYGNFVSATNSWLESPSRIERLSKYRTVTVEELRSRVELYSSLKQVVPELATSRVAVCHAAKTALELRHACGQQSIPIPGKLSIVSLEESPACLHKGITTCIRDWEANGYLMAHALIGDIPVALTNHKFIFARARIMQRGST